MSPFYDKSCGFSAEVVLKKRKEGEICEGRS